ncbi:MAG: superinfection immunity protein [Dehalococcoidia bacterium]|nr:superinfection immunity protein [Dehalococcoidia bacterium]
MLKKTLALLIASGILWSGGCVPAPRMHMDISWPWFPVFYVPFGLVSMALYFLPTIVILARRKKNVLGPILVNILLGWTVVGWIAALIWAIVVDE